MKYSGIIFLALIILAGSEIQAQFGKNKVQYENFEWQYIESTHFDVFFHDGEQELAEFCAVESEKALKSIEKTLNYKLSSRITIVVYNSHNQYQQTNIIQTFMSEAVGGVTELFKNRIAIPFQGNYSQFRHVIHHELVHGVLNDMFHGGTIQSSISSGGFFIPIWMNEGFAEYESLGGMDSETDMFMRDITIGEKLPQLNRISGYLSYRAGQSFYWYVAEKYGKQKVGDLINRLRIQKNVEAAFKSSFNMSIKEFSEKWEKDMKKYYWPDLDIFNAPEDYAVPVTDREKIGNFYNSSPSISPDGQKMAFISEDGGVLGISVMEIGKMESIRQLISSFRQQDFEDLNMLAPGISWNPSGTHLAISAKAGAEDAIFLVNEEDGDYKKMTFGLKSITSVVWSPDGKQLAFVASKGNQSDIYVYTIQTETLNNVTNDIFSDMFPAWGPDSKEVYFVSDRGEYTGAIPDGFKMYNFSYNSTDIYKVNIESRGIERLTNSPDNGVTSIAVSSGGDQLLYVSDKNGIGNLYELNLTSGQSRPLTNSITGITQISLSADNSKLLFASQVEGGYDIFMFRYPFEVTLEMDELPLTSFKQNSMNLETSIEEIVSDDEEYTDVDNNIVGYGDYGVDFAFQKVVKPNKDARKEGSPSTSSINIDTNFTPKDYKIKFTPDLIFGNPGYSTFFGFQGVTQMLFSDILGDHQIYAQANLLFDIRNSTFMVAYNYLPDIVDFSFQAFHNPAYIYSTDANGFQDLYRFRNFGLGAVASYPFNLFNRLEFGMTWMNLDKTNIDRPQESSLTRSLLVPEARFVHDDVLWGYLAPHTGTRYYIGLKGSPKIGDSGLEFLTATTDFRTYLPLNDYMNFAVRIAGGSSFGADPQGFFLGGTDNWLNRSFSNDQLPFENPEDFAFMQFVYPLRGWDINEIAGDKYFITNLEFRFPLFQAILAGPLPILLQGVMGSVFLDAGGVWDGHLDHFEYVNGTKQYDLLISSGIGVRAVLLGLPWKLDIAWRNEGSVWSEPRYLISLGLDY